MKWAAPGDLGKFFDANFKDTTENLKPYTPKLSIQPGNPTSHLPVEANLYETWVEYGKEHAKLGITPQQDFTNETNYPALNYAHNYGTRNNVEGELFFYQLH